QSYLEMRTEGVRARRAARTEALYARRVVLCEQGTGVVCGKTGVLLLLPQSGGIPMDRLKDVDWSKVNLDEWIGILSATAKLPDAASINIDGLTGSENYLDIYDSRDDAAERANKRVEDLDTTGIRLQ